MRTTSEIMTALTLLAVAPGSPPATEMVSAARAEQFTQDCQTSNPSLERLASAIQRGEIDYVRSALDGGIDINETWRDLPAQICRSLLVRSIWYSKDEIFTELLKRGADPSRLPREMLTIPVRDGRVEMARKLLALGLKPQDNDALVREALQSHNPAMIDLLASSGVAINASNVPSWALTDELTVHMVPKYLQPNDRLGNVGQ